MKELLLLFHNSSRGFFNFKILHILLLNFLRTEVLNMPHVFKVGSYWVFLGQMKVCQENLYMCILQKADQLRMRRKFG